jgi:hypothetical protein
MVKSESAHKLDELLVDVGKFLKQEGFRKRNHTFNKIVDTGLIHVVNFQMGQFPVGNYLDIPFFRPNLYGKFTVNFGVFVSEIYEATFNHPLSKYINEYDCEIRMRLGSLMYQTDKWWDLGQEKANLKHEILEGLVKFGLPYLKRFTNRKAIIREWEQNGSKIGLPPRAKLSIAIVLAYQGEINKAKELLESEYIEKHGKPYASFVIAVSRSLGIILE